MSRHGKGHFEDPADNVVEALFQHISEDLGTDTPVETFGHPDESRIGRLVGDEREQLATQHYEGLAVDSRDVDLLSAEEAAIHLVSEEDEDNDRDVTLTRSAREALEGF